MVDAAGYVLAGRYRLETLLGRGGMGAVWQAEDRLLGRRVAVKQVLPPAGLDEADAARLHQRMLREARAAARLDHPAIVHVHDVVVEDDRPWIVMQLVRGRSLDQVVREDGPLPPERVARIGLDLLAALNAAHAEGVLHRDVTPRNVLLADDGRALLTDFGIAAVAGATRLTGTGALIGSPGYMAPERLRNEPVGPESDLWSLGATLYAAVEGRPAYQAEEVAALIAAVLTRQPSPPVRAGRLAPVVLALLAEDPAGRPTAEQARRQLQQVAEGRTADVPEPVTRPLPPPPAVPPTGRTIEIAPHFPRVYLKANVWISVPSVALVTGYVHLTEPGFMTWQLFLGLVAGLLLFMLLPLNDVRKQRLVLGPEGLLCRNEHGSATVPLSAVRWIGPLREGRRRGLAICLDAEHPTARNWLRYSLVGPIWGSSRMGTIRLTRGFHRPSVEEVREYVLATGLVPWHE